VAYYTSLPRWWWFSPGIPVSQPTDKVMLWLIFVGCETKIPGENHRHSVNLCSSQVLMVVISEYLGENNHPFVSH
jgi:hypothetical protein